jgi:hypothetical protein
VLQALSLRRRRDADRAVGERRSIHVGAILTHLFVLPGSPIAIALLALSASVVLAPLHDCEQPERQGQSASFHAVRL